MNLWVNQQGTAASGDQTCLWQGKNLPVKVELKNTFWRVKIKNKTFKISLPSVTSGITSCMLNDSQVHFGWNFANGVYSIVIDGCVYDIKLDEFQGLSDKSIQGLRAKRLHELRSPIPGLISDIAVKEGYHVVHDQHLLTLDAMKMQNEIASPITGMIYRICVDKGQTVEKNQLLMVIT